MGKAGIYTKKKKKTHTNYLKYMILMMVVNFIIVFKKKSEHNLNDLIPNFIRYYGVMRCNDHMLISDENYSNIKIFEYSKVKLNFYQIVIII